MYFILYLIISARMSFWLYDRQKNHLSPRESHYNGLQIYSS